MARLTKTQRVQVLGRLLNVALDTGEADVVRKAARTLLRTNQRDGDELRAAFDTLGNALATSQQKLDAIRVIADTLR